MKGDVEHFSASTDTETEITIESSTEISEKPESGERGNDHINQAFRTYRAVHSRLTVFILRFSNSVVSKVIAYYLHYVLPAHAFAFVYFVYRGKSSWLYSLNGLVLLLIYTSFFLLVITIFVPKGVLISTAKRRQGSKNWVANTESSWSREAIKLATYYEMVWRVDKELTITAGSMNATVDWKFLWELAVTDIESAAFSCFKSCHKSCSSSRHHHRHFGLVEPNYYDVLGVKSDCSQKEIRAAYLELCKQHHPDKQVAKGDDQQQQQQQQQTGSSDDNAATSSKARFQRINEAYDCLSRERERSRYDHDLQTGNTGAFYYRANVDPQAYYRRHGYPRSYGNAQYYDNFTRMHYGFQYKQPKDGHIRDVELFGTSFAVFIVASLIIASILQSYSQWLDAQMLKANTERKFELMSQMYQQVYIVYRDWARRNMNVNSNGSTNSDNKEQQVKFNLYKDNSVRSRNKDFFCENDKQESSSSPLE
ncbi:DnaJ sub A member 3, mitochondrial [Tyrophagus putrescentiae]|nr:DnaJ sub A member 3, mitochondrial [Tyrophagus putrescentiae]